MPSPLKRTMIAAAVAAVAGFAAFASHAASESPRANTCVRLQSIDETPVIDDSTVLIKMKGGTFKRMDLVANCPGLKQREGFKHRSHNDQLCTVDTLRTLEPGGATCMIKQIVDISPDEAKDLMAKR